ncbi:transporter substrate-binding domain-containing protein [Mesorhizobium sp. PUT5]|uniref:transporter substrate-binding domain-containing protein n=1 Tax=Mesorhizobium sp. PUT5 TaxID=3454629 RepID=UPI003FA4AE87
MTTNIADVLAPTGRLRAAINHSNTVLAQHDPDSGEVSGVTVELAGRLADRLGVPLSLLPFGTAAASFAAVTGGEADLAFLAIDAKRAAAVHFTAPYVRIEGTYVVPPDGPVRPGDADSAGMRIAVVSGSALDLHLSRNIRHAEILGFENDAAAVSAILSGRADIFAGVRTLLAALLPSLPGHRVLEGRFMTIDQAACMPIDRVSGFAALDIFVEEMKATGMIEDAIQRSGQSPDLAVAAGAGLR